MDVKNDSWMAEDFYYVFWLFSFSCEWLGGCKVCSNGGGEVGGVIGLDKSGYQ